MPELPEVETVRTGLAREITGELIEDVHLAREGLRVPFTPDMAEILMGNRVLAVRRRAKYLVWDLEGGQALIAHLGMSGRFTVLPAQADYQLQKHDHVWMQFASGKKLIYNDARRFGVMVHCPAEELTAHPLLASLGPEPLEEEFTADYLRHELAKRKVPVKIAIMDQSLVVGVGNIYASEALFRAGIHPQSPACEVADCAEALHGAIQQVLREALASGGSSLRDFYHASGEMGYFQHRFDVYDRAGEPCRRCAEPLQKIVQGGRSSFFCGVCQTLPGGARPVDKKRKPVT